MFRPIASWMTRRAVAAASRRQGPDALHGLPAVCDICAAWPARTFCDECVARFARPQSRCATCALPVPPGLSTCGACLRLPPPLDTCVAAVRYGHPWDRPIAALKFRGQAGLAGALARLLLRADGAGAALAAADLVVPMPLSAARLRERGFNQAALLARPLAPGRCDGATLLRIRDTPPLSGLTRAARQAQVRGAFAVEPARAARLAGRRVLLVDDVMTSGATLHEAARALRIAGAVSVSALVFARTPLE